LAVRPFSTRQQGAVGQIKRKFMAASRPDVTQVRQPDSD
jgi:hypothetical protein